MENKIIPKIQIKLHSCYVLDKSLVYLMPIWADHNYWLIYPLFYDQRFITILTLKGDW